MPEETFESQPLRALTPVAELIERAWQRFKRLFSGLFPWLVISTLGGFMAVLSHAALPLWSRLILSIVGMVVLLLSYLAQVRIISGVEREPGDIINNGRVALKLFFPYVWLVLIEIFIFLSGALLFVIPAIIFGVYLLLTPFVFVVEGSRGLPAFTRSWGYITGRWWASLWRLLVALFLSLVVMSVINFILALIFGSFSTMHASSWSIMLFQQLVEAFLIVPWLLCYLFEFYQDVRSAKPVAQPSDEKTARLWLVIFLILGIILALVFAFGTVTHTAAHSSVTTGLFEQNFVQSW